MIDVRDRLKADPTSVTFAFPVGLGSPLHVSVVNVGKAAGAPASKVVAVDAGRLRREPRDIERAQHAAVKMDPRVTAENI
jgi:hypothetical protein